MMLWAPGISLQCEHLINLLVADNFYRGGLLPSELKTAASGKSGSLIFYEQKVKRLKIVSLWEF